MLFFAKLFKEKFMNKAPSKNQSTKNSVVSNLKSLANLAIVASLFVAFSASASNTNYSSDVSLTASLIQNVDGVVSYSQPKLVEQTEYQSLASHVYYISSEGLTNEQAGVAFCALVSNITGVKLVSNSAVTTKIETSLSYNLDAVYLNANGGVSGSVLSKDAVASVIQTASCKIVP